MDHTIASGSADLAVDLPPGDGWLFVFLTSTRLLFLAPTGGTTYLHWWAYLDEIDRVDLLVRRQNRVFNASRETIVTLNLCDGERVVYGHIHVVDGARRTKRFVNALTAAVAHAGQAGLR